MARRTKEEARATRDLLLDTAERVFHQRGVSRTSLNEIAAAAGVSRGAIYWHFEDKADLFNAMMMRVTLPMEQEVQGLGSPQAEDPLAQIRRSLLGALHKTATDPQVRRVFEIATHKVEYVDELSGVRERHLGVRNDCLHHVALALEQAMAQGRITDRVPARHIAFGLHALVDGLIQNWMLDPQAFDLVEVGGQVLEAYLAGLSAGGGAGRASKASRHCSRTP
ncbi:TetR family transcriptional regulator [Piscinibacter sakaiensis]|uniref:TetR family transcriptional regulator n=1 Tax=Piscinibacter sakaiensis TaxID=1547922 RepID=UPI0006B455A9|nr:TetR family transcriptional regulator [Piscinibacter sakaiensis]